MPTAYLSLTLLASFGAVLLVLLAGRANPKASGWVALGAAAVALWLLSGAALRTAPAVELPWIPAWGVSMTLGLDGLGLAYGLLTTFVAVLVLAFAPRYMRHHLDSAGRPLRQLGGFYAIFTLFIAAMVGLVLSLDLLLLFFFWDITTLCSYLLIAFDREQREARRAAAMALRVTGVSAVLLLAATLLLSVRYSTTDLYALAEAATGDALTGVAVVLIMVAALAKSAQWPLHFWLPRAMAAPTPVSAYLHAAAMVAAGVFLLQRTQPLFEAQAFGGPALMALGFTSMLAGGCFALRETGMKRVLAYSTVAQYGHVVFLIGLGGAHGAAAATYFVVAHGLCKSALFLTAGAVTHATGRHSLEELGGLRHQAPWLAWCSAVAAAGLAGVPLSIGFFKDELLFSTAADHGTWMLLLAVTGPGLTVAYIWRFWSSIFLGPKRDEDVSMPASLVLPIGVAAVVTLALGLTPAPLARLAEAAAAASMGTLHLELGYHFDARPANLAALGAFALGALLGALRSRLQPPIAAVARAFGPERLYELGERALAFSGQVARQFGPGPLRTRVAIVFVATALLVIAGELVEGTDAPTLELTLRDAPAAAALLATCAGALATVSRRQQLTTTLALSATTLALAAVFALAGAPDVALVLVLINVVSTLLIVALLYRIPGTALTEQQLAPSFRKWRWRDELIATSGAAFAFLVAWGTLAYPRPEVWLGDRLLEASDRAHAGNAVTATLVDFRGLDTMGEITVIVISVIALDTLMRAARRDE